MKKKSAIVVKDISKTFIINQENRLTRSFPGNKNPLEREISVLKDISFTVYQHEIIGLYGANGSGKSTLLRIISGIMFPDKGEVTVQGKIATALDLGSGLHPELCGIDNIHLVSALLGNSKKHLKKNINNIIDFSELQSFMYLPVKHYSSGMLARLAFSIVAFSEADILLLDEIFAVGDIEFRDKCRVFIKNLRQTKTILFTSHEFAIIQNLADRALKLDRGTLQNEKNDILIQFIKSLPNGSSFEACAESNSMLPIISKGHKIIIRKVPFNKVKVNDIIAFSLLNLPEIIVHRVINIINTGNAQTFITKGDNSYSFDTWQVGKNNFIGKIIKIN